MDLHVSNKQEAHSPPQCSPEKHFQVINTAEKTYEYQACSFKALFSSHENEHDLLFKKNLIPFTIGCFMPRLIELAPLVLENKIFNPLYLRMLCAKFNWNLHHHYKKTMWNGKKMKMAIRKAYSLQAFSSGELGGRVKFFGKPIISSLLLFPHMVLSHSFNCEIKIPYDLNFLIQFSGNILRTYDLGLNGLRQDLLIGRLTLGSLLGTPKISTHLRPFCTIGSRASLSRLMPYLATPGMLATSCMSSSWSL